MLQFPLLHDSTLSNLVAKHYGLSLVGMGAVGVIELLLYNVILPHKFHGFLIAV